MTYTKLWETPQASINGCSTVEFSYAQGTARIVVKYKEDGRPAQKTLTFENAVYFRHVGGLFVTAEEINAYEQLIEWAQSDLLAELKDRNAEEFGHRRCRHFSLYTQDDRLFDIVADSYKTDD